MGARLEDSSGNSFPIGERCTIGRLPENTIALPTTRVSRWHALIHAAPNGACWLADLGSSNGVLLNGVRLREPTELADGDTIEIGGSRFRFRGPDGRFTRAARDQRLAEFYRQRTEHPGTAYAPVEQAALLLSPTGRLTHVSDRARDLLAAYFPEKPATALPAAVDRWLRQPRAAEPLAVPRGDKRLLVRVVESGSAQRILLLAEEQRVFAPEQLEQLGLTRREGEVLHWMAEGKTNPEIATILGSSPATVKKQAEHIFAKLGVENRASAILRVIELRLGHAAPAA